MLPQEEAILPAAATQTAGRASTLLKEKAAANTSAAGQRTVTDQRAMLNKRTQVEDLQRQLAVA